TPIWRIASAMGCPCETRTSTCRSFATISSGLYRFLAITVLLDVKDIPQVGPLQWGRIMAICDLDVAPAFERSKHHEEIGGAIALVLIIETGRASRFHRDRHARFGNELLRGLVEANQRTIAVAWPRIDGQHVFHNGYERAVGLRRDDPVLAAM